MRSMRGDENGARARSCYVRGAAVDVISGQRLAGAMAATETTPRAIPLVERRVPESVTIGSLVCAAAIEDAGLTMDERREAGIFLGVCHGREEFIQRAGLLAQQLKFTDFCDPVSFVESSTSSVLGHLASDHSLSGPAMTINTFDLSGLDAIGAAYCFLKTSGLDCALAGSTESADGLRIANGIGSPGSTARTAAGWLVLQAQDSLPAADIQILAYVSEAIGEHSLDFLLERAFGDSLAWPEVALVTVAGGTAAICDRFRDICQCRGIAVEMLDDRLDGLRAARGAIIAAYTAERLKSAPGVRRLGMTVLLDAAVRLSALLLERA